MSKIIINKINVFPNELAIQWSDNSESFIGYKELRDSCPCAYCDGEVDALGNKYQVSNKIKLTDRSYMIDSISKVGHYGIQIWWADKHRDGIYTFDHLRGLGG